MPERLRMVVQGAVQGVGFRPFVYRLANELSLTGWVVNTAQGVHLEIEGLRPALDAFSARLRGEPPPRAVLQSVEASFLDPVGYSSFEIRESEAQGAKTAFILPDLATCADCRQELFDAGDRRFRYPFTNCTNCGPRFSIIESLPYDRAQTSMKHFTMCAECAHEYHDPNSRRFHAQPNACPRCGPQLALWDRQGKVLAKLDDALGAAAEALRAGKILALKGLGGFQLLVNAANEGSVAELRRRKQRAEKPFALMVPSLETARQLCRLSPLEERMLLSPEAPIVLLPRRATAPLAPSLAPGNPNLGLMLPTSPLHHLLLHSLGIPLVATSGNSSDEPICIDEREALQRLAKIADLFLVHDRPIVRHVDDSIVRAMAGRELVLRRARGYAPLPLPLPEDGPSVLALGAHLKNSVALGVGRNAFVSQHLGDLETPEAYAAFVRAAADLPRLYECVPEIVACDLHPEYLSTQHALELPGRKVQVPHHWAHIAACMAENEVAPPALGVSWDGTGYGLDGTIWGGEFLRALPGGGCERVAHLRTFRLPGGTQAIREPRRCALGLLHEIFGEALWDRPQLLRDFLPNELPLLRQMLAKNVQAPRTSSAGRFFDAVAALLGLRARVSFEGQAAMALEFSLQAGVADAYPFRLTETIPLQVDWEPAIRALLADLDNEVSPGIIAAKVHHMLTESIVAVAVKLGEAKVVLSGGCFQNRYLTERTIARLRAENFRPYWHQRIPPNDGGIALGQIVAARHAR